MLKNCCSSRMLCVWTVIVGLLFGGSLLLAFWGIPKIIVQQIHEQTQLKEGTDQWDRFIDLPFPIDYSIRFFEVTNADDVINKTAVPILNETEPYKYTITISKENHRFDDIDEDSVTYKRKFQFQFNNSGNTKETDEIKVTNPLLMSALQLVTDLERLALAGCIDKLLKPYGLDKFFIRVTVKEILFDGIIFARSDEKGLGVACEIVRQKMIKIVENVRVIEHITNNTSGADYLRIAFFNYKTGKYVGNKSPDGIYTVNRGRTNMSALGNIMRWNGGNRLTTYGNIRSTNNDTCQILRGTDSTIYSPQIHNGQDIVIYNTDLCRTVRLFYQSSDETYNGIPAFRYQTSKTIFRSSTISADDDCYCSKATTDAIGNDNCYLDGVFDLKPCIGAPIIISQPHFLHADDKYVNAVRGLKSDESKHGIYLLIEPNTGTPLEGMKRVQLNIVLRRESLISMITPKTMYHGIIPTLWLEEGFRLPQKYVDQLNSQYFNKVKLAGGFKYGLVAAFASLFAACIFVVWRKECFKNRKH